MIVSLRDKIAYIKTHTQFNSLQSIADRLGCSYSAVRLYASGYEPEQEPAEVAEKIRELYREVKRIHSK